MADAIIEKEVARMQSKYGAKSAFSGRQALNFEKQVIPTGILALDYALGTGGYLRGAPYHVWGPPDIGKSSSIGLASVVQAQKLGIYPGIIALEPSFDARWAEKHGVDLDKCVIAYPDNGQEAFEILHDWVSSKVLEFIVFDSIGAVASESEVDGGKAMVGGNSKLITEGIRKIVMRSWKNQVGLLLLNQVRDDLDSMYGGFQPPGGHAVQHFSPTWIEVKPYGGKEGRFTIKKDMGEKKPTEVLVGRQLVAHVKRNKTSEGTGQKAIFQYFQMETDDFPFGIDIGFDVANTGTVTGVIGKSAAWYHHESFPKGKLNGKTAVGNFIRENQDSYNQIRNEILDVMIQKAGVPKNVGPINED